MYPLDSYILPQDKPNYKLEYCTRNGKLNTEKLLNILLDKMAGMWYNRNFEVGARGREDHYTTLLEICQ